MISQEDIETWINDQKVDWQNDEDEFEESMRNENYDTDERMRGLAQASSVEVPTAEYEDDNKPSKLPSTMSENVCIASTKTC